MNVSDRFVASNLISICGTGQLGCTVVICTPNSNIKRNISLLVAKTGETTQVVLSIKSGVDPRSTPLGSSLKSLVDLKNDRKNVRPQKTGNDT